MNSETKIERAPRYRTKRVFALLRGDKPQAGNG